MNIFAISSTLNSNFPKNTSCQRNISRNLFAPNVDTFSFCGKANKDSVNMDWIEDNATKNIVNRIMKSNKKPVLSVRKFETLLRYFGYDVENKTNSKGDHVQYEPFAYKNKGINFTIPARKDISVAAVKDLERAFKIINKTNGELMPTSPTKGTHTEEEIAAFIEKTKEYNPDGNNRYRAFLEKAKKEEEERQETEGTQAGKNKSAKQISAEIRIANSLKQKKDEIVERINRILKYDSEISAQLLEIKNNFDEIIELANNKGLTKARLFEQIVRLRNLESNLNQLTAKDSEKNKRRSEIMAELEGIKENINNLKSNKQAKSKLTRVEHLKKEYIRIYSNLTEDALIIELANLELLNAISDILSSMADSLDVETEPTVQQQCAEEIPPTETISADTTAKEAPQIQEQTQIEKEWANKLFDDLAQHLSTIPAQEIISDMRTMVQNMFSAEELSVLENCTVAEYSRLIQININLLSSKNEFREAKRAEAFAVVEYLTTTGKLKDDEDIYSKLPQIDRIINEHEIDYSSVSKLYSTYKQKLAPEVSDKIATSIIDCIDNAQNSDKDNMQNMLNEKCAYFELLNDKKAGKGIRTALLKLAVSDFDKLYGTNYSDNIENIITKFFKKEDEEAKQKALQSINYQYAFSNIW